MRKIEFNKKYVMNLVGKSDADIKKAVDKACMITLGLELVLALCLYGAVSRLFGEFWGGFTMFMLYAVSVKNKMSDVNREAYKEALAVRDKAQKEKERNNDLEEDTPEEGQTAEEDK